MSLSARVLIEVDTSASLGESLSSDRSIVVKGLPPRRLPEHS